MNVPESISTYRLTGFSISPTNGLGIVNVPARVFFQYLNSFN